MKHKDCIFVAEDDCPKEHVQIDCIDCEKYKYHETIGRAVKDFTGLGESYTAIFELHKKLIDGHGKTIDIETPVEAIFEVNRVMSAYLSKDRPYDKNEILYRRLVNFFFKIIIDEFEDREYTESDYVH